MDKMNEYPRQPGEHVMYKSMGICLVSDIRRENFTGFGERVYYVLRSVFDSGSVVFVPADDVNLTAEMRHILSAGEIGETISDADRLDAEWIGDDKERAAEFS